MPLTNSTTLNDLVGQIVAQDAQSAAYAARVLRPLIRGYLVPPGAGSIVVPRFQPVAVAALTEGVAPSSTTVNTDGVTLTPTERGTYVQISKRALHADPFQDLAPYGEQLGRSLAQDEDKQIIAKMNFTTSVGNPANDITLPNFLDAVSALEQANAPGPYFAVFHPKTWSKMRAIFDDWSVYANVGKQTVEGFGPGFTNANGYVGSPFGIPSFITTSITDNGTSRANVVFSRESIGCAWIRDIGVDIDDNVVARALDLMAWYSADCAKLINEYGVTLVDKV